MLYCCSIAIGGTPCFSEDSFHGDARVCVCECVCVRVEGCDWPGGLWAGGLSLRKRLSQTQSSRSPHRDGETTLFLTDLSTSLHPPPPPLHSQTPSFLRLALSSWPSSLSSSPSSFSEEEDRKPPDPHPARSPWQRLSALASLRSISCTRSWESEYGFGGPRLERCVRPQFPSEGIDPQMCL